MVGGVRSDAGRRAARAKRLPLSLCLMLSGAMLALAGAASAETWRGLTVAPEHRCAPYDRKRDYPYPQSVERRIIERLGGRVYGPYTGRHFDSRRQTDIEHMVATSEAHDSGLCAADASTRAAFARDPDNLTLAAPAVNRCGAGGKCGYDAGEWLPERNRCWFAGRVVAVKRKYGLTVDAREAGRARGGAARLRLDAARGLRSGRGHCRVIDVRACLVFNS